MSEQPPEDPTLDELQAFYERRIEDLHAQIDATNAERADALARHAAAYAEMRKVGGPDILVAVELTGLKALAGWVAKGETEEERQRRAAIAKQAATNALEGVDAADFNQRLRDEVRRAIQGNPN